MTSRKDEGNYRYKVRRNHEFRTEPGVSPKDVAQQVLKKMAQNEVDTVESWLSHVTMAVMDAQYLVCGPTGDGTAPYTVKEAVNSLVEQVDTKTVTVSVFNHPKDGRCYVRTNFGRAIAETVPEWESYPSNQESHENRHNPTANERFRDWVVAEEMPLESVSIDFTTETLIDDYLDKSEVERYRKILDGDVDTFMGILDNHRNRDTILRSRLAMQRISSHKASCTIPNWAITAAIHGDEHPNIKNMASDMGDILPPLCRDYLRGTIERTSGETTDRSKLVAEFIREINATFADKRS